jgi:hypothetical protein
MSSGTGRHFGGNEVVNDSGFPMGALRRPRLTVRQVRIVLDGTGGVHEALMIAQAEDLVLRASRFATDHSLETEALVGSILEIAKLTETPAPSIQAV